MPEKDDQEELAAIRELKLARAVFLGVPALSVATALGVGLVSSAGPAILVLACGALLSVIAFLWVSIRTLTGDAPLPPELELVGVRVDNVDDLAERKRRALRALKDLEHEHAVGKVDDKDFAALDAKLRGEAKELFRRMDAEVEPLRARATELADAHLRKKGLLPLDAAKSSSDAEGSGSAPSRDSKRTDCSSCGASNEADARFCKACGRAVGAPDSVTEVENGQ